MINLFIYEVKRLIFTKVNFAILGITVLYSYYILSTVTLFGTAYTAPFSKWSFAQFLCEIMPVFMLSLILQAASVFSLHEESVRRITRSTPFDDTKYLTVKYVSVLLSFMLNFFIAFFTAAVFYICVFQYTDFAEYLLPILLVIAPPVLFILGLSFLFGVFHGRLPLVLLPVAIILSFIDLPVNPAFSPFIMKTIRETAYHITKSADGQAPFILPDALVLSRAIFMLAGILLFVSAILFKGVKNHHE